MPIPREELDQIRADAVTLEQATGRVWRRTAIITPGGGEAVSWTPGVNVPCRVAPVDGGLNESEADRIDDRTTHMGTLPAFTVVEEGDQLEIGGQGLFEVLAVRKRSFDEFVRRVELIESEEQVGLEGSAS